MTTGMDDPRLTAYALGELDGDERREVEALMASSAEARAAVEAVRETAALLEGELAKEPGATLGESARQQIEARVLAGRIRRWAGYAAAACVVLLVGGFAASVVTPSLNRSWSLVSHETQLALGPDGSDGGVRDAKNGISPTKPDVAVVSVENQVANQVAPTEQEKLTEDELRQLRSLGYVSLGGTGSISSQPGQPSPNATNREGAGPVVYLDTRPDVGARKMEGSLGVPSTNSFALSHRKHAPQTPASEVPKIRGFQYRDISDQIAGDVENVKDGFDIDQIREYRGRSPVYPENTGESYDGVVDNPFFAVLQSPLSTLSIDVDTASYANIRRMLNGNQLPPASAVRIEEMVNYFSYSYPQPEGDRPFSVNIETASCPWKSEHRLVRIGLKGREVPPERRLPCNLVFLIDVSGSMQDANKLPLVKQGLAMLVQRLSEKDRVAMVVYAGASGLALPSTPVSQKQVILDVIEHLEAGGSTNGGEGIQLAYKIAGENFDKEGVNRVILATDGDFNVGVTTQNDLVKLVEEKAKSGVFLSVLGFGMGNLKDSTLEKLADKGNGNYAYIDTFAEAKKVLVDQMAGTLVTIAKDVKIQIEFNPAQVASYRLIGYENRILAARDFNDDKKDAGEIGAGHTVTALYEIVPTSASTAGVDALKYQTVENAPKPRRNSDELLTLKLRYKKPDGDTSKLIETPVKDSQKSFDEASDDLRFAASVAGFGMMLRNSPHQGDWTYDAVLNTATRSMGRDASGYRAEFVDLVRKAKTLSGSR